LLVISTVAIAATAGCGSSSAGSNGVLSKSGKQIVAAAVSATAHESAFHFVETASSSASNVRIVGDVGSAGGEQRIDVSEGGRSGKITVVLADGTAYFTGDVFGLEGFTGLSEANARSLAGKWISVPSSNASFSSIAASLAVKTAASQLVSLTGTLTRGKVSTELGHQAVAVDAVQSSSSGSLALTLYVSTTGKALPIQVVGTTKTSGTPTRKIKATFSNWGETVHASAPSSSEPIADVKALAG
jgi:hypothetical protein